jgi:hypothetical protein
VLIAEDGASATVIPQGVRCYCIKWICDDWEIEADGGFKCWRWDCAQWDCIFENPPRGLNDSPLHDVVHSHWGSHVNNEAMTTLASLLTACIS